MKLVIGENDLQSKYPELAKQWNYKKNGSLSPSDFVCGSNKKIWWICAKGHEWETMISNRTKGGGCPYCSNKKLLRGYNDLQTTHPELAAEWDYEKNYPLTPGDVQYGSGKIVWWVGKCGHSFKAKLNMRSSNGTGCPYCCESHAKLLSGFNDLATTNPELLSSWDYEKNGDLKPSMVMKGQHKKVWWTEKCGHSWQATIYHRVQGRGCPICRRESKTSFPEQAIYYYLKKCYPDAISTDRDILDGKELDIYIPSIKYAIEFDGFKWHKEIEKDITKNELCQKKGISLIRIRDVECPLLPETDNIYIINHDGYNDNELKRCILRVTEILNISVDININRDRSNIYNQYLAQKKENSLAESFPELCEEWNYKRNGDLFPQLITRQSDKKVWWIGKCGHEWQAVVSTRTKGHGCPYCNSNRLLSGFNDLATTNPELCELFDEEKNGKNISEISPNLQVSLYWKCSKGHSYKKNLKTMLKHIGDFDEVCPYCNKLLSKTVNEKGAKKANGTNNWRKALSLTLDLSNPESLNEWDYERNKIRPNEITLGTDKKVWWKCINGHSYEATPSNHINLHRGCPYCSGHKVLKGYNDLASQMPSLMSEWDYEKNGDFKPDSITLHSGKKAWWRCSKGHSWYAVIDSRSKGIGCPYCSGQYKKSVRNIETGEVYKSLAEAAKSCGLKVGDTISLCCQGKQKVAAGFHWEYVDKED